MHTLLASETEGGGDDAEWAPAGDPVLNQLLNRSKVVVPDG